MREVEHMDNAEEAYADVDDGTSSNYESKVAVYIISDCDQISCCRDKYLFLSKLLSYK